MKGSPSMKITCHLVSNLSESIVASGLPMVTSYDEKEFEIDVKSLNKLFTSEELTKEEKEKCLKHLKRAYVLSGCEGGESHDCFLCGINVSMNISAPKKWWEEFQRYHFMDIISATSTMHRAGQLVSSTLPMAFDESVLKEPELKAFFERKQKEFKDGKKDERWLDALRFCLPLGTIQTARVTTNYRSLKTIFRQRHNHRLEEWKVFCEFIQTLPLSGFMIPYEEDVEKDLLFAKLI